MTFVFWLFYYKDFMNEIGNLDSSVVDRKTFLFQTT